METNTSTPDREFDRSGRDAATGERVYDIERRPILYHEIRVRSYNGTRTRRVRPVSAADYYGMGGGMGSCALGDCEGEICSGETIVACVPATPGSYAVYASQAPGRPPARRDDDYCLGTVIADGTNTPREFDWDEWAPEAGRVANRHAW